MSTVLFSMALIASFVALVRQTISAEDRKAALRREQERADRLMQEKEDAKKLAAEFQLVAQSFEKRCTVAEDAREDAERRAAMASTKALALEHDREYFKREYERLKSAQASPFPDVSDEEMRNFIVYDGTGRGQSEVSHAAK